MNISMIVINYNAAHILRETIDSLLMQEGDDYEVIVADNMSADNSLDLLKSYGDKINLIANKKNLGYGKANNEAVKHAKGKYLWLINPDAQLTEKHDVKKAIEFLDNNSEIAIASTRVINMAGDRVTFRPQGYYPGDKKLKTKLPDLPGELCWVYGASMLVRKDEFEKISGFDEEYFVNGEDADLCIRARKAGFQIGYCGDITARHLGRGSEVNANAYNTWLRVENANYLFADKHYELADQKRIARANKWHALADIIVLNLRKIFGLSEGSKKRLIHYYAIYKTSCDYLARKNKNQP